MFSHNILRLVCDDIWNAGPFSIIVDDTQDVTGIEQETICIRYVENRQLKPVEVFMGLYSMDSTTGEALARMIEDVLLRFNLSIFNLRVQTYDGAANMAGSYNSCQAIISRMQPLALYVHCGAHCVNLVAQSAAAECTDIMAAMTWLQELDKFFGSSIKFRQLFAQVAVTDAEGHRSAIKPLCPTRWMMRTPAINSILTQYEAVLESLEAAKTGQKDIIPEHHHWSKCVRKDQHFCFCGWLYRSLDH